MDIADSIVPNSDQVNAEDLLAGPRTVTITGVEKGTKDQPVFVMLAEFPSRTFRPGKSMRRVLVAAWGTEASAYVGRKLTLYNDPTVKWGGQAVGGVRISHMSHIPSTLTVALTVTRGKRAPFVVQPLTSGEGTADLAQALRDAGSVGELQSVWLRVQLAGLSADEDLVVLKDTRKQELREAVSGD